MLQPKSGMSQILEYDPTDVFYAAVTAIEKAERFTLEDVNPKTKILRVSAKVSLRSWGEKIIISIRPSQYGTEVTIDSQSKMALIDWGKNQDNLAELLELISEEIEG